MKTVKMLGLTFVVMLALGALSASAAMAYEWQINGSPLEGTVVNTTATSKVTFENSSEGEAFTCTIVRKRTLTGEGRGEVTSVTSSGGAKAIPCEVTRAGAICESGVEVEALGLPWSTELAAVSGLLRDKTLGSPEWKIKCKKSGIKNTNWCGVSPNAGPHNAEGGVEETTDPVSPNTSCLYGSLVTRGAEKLTSTLGTLRVNPPAPLKWIHAGSALTEPLGVQWKGKLKLTTSSGTFVECAETLEGSATSGGLGGVTKSTSSECDGRWEEPLHSGFCETTTKTFLEAKNVPWGTELSRTEGSLGEVVRDNMLNGGSGTPVIKVSCAMGGLKEKVECSGAIDPVLSNGIAGVLATFDNDEELTCTNGQTARTEGTLTIAPSTGGLEIS